VAPLGPSQPRCHDLRCDARAPPPTAHGCERTALAAGNTHT